MTRTTSFRSIWISDLHLGTRGCKAQDLLDFLRRFEAETLYLVGDIVDGWYLGHPAWYWSAAQTAVVAEIAAWRRRGANVVYLPGNHDESNADLIQELFGPISSRTELIHRTADGRRMLVIHGHQFDGSLDSASWLSMFVNPAYTMALRMNQWYHSDEEPLRPGQGRRSLPAYLKDRFKKAVHFLSSPDIDSMLEIVHQHGADGVICGHFHCAEQRLIGPVWYANDGDWVHSCTALIEDHGGALRLLRWSSRRTSPDMVGEEAAS